MLESDAKLAEQEDQAALTAEVSSFQVLADTAGGTAPNLRFLGGNFYNLDKLEWWSVMIRPYGGPETVFPKARMVADVRDGKSTLKEARKRFVGDAVQALLYFGMVVFGILYILMLLFLSLGEAGCRPCRSFITYLRFWASSVLFFWSITSTYRFHV
jgi:hypothetical protein